MKTKRKKKGSKHSLYVSTKSGKTEKADSSYEARRMRALDESPLVKRWTKDHRIRIGYKDGRRRRRYIPDFLIEMTDGRVIIEEVKGHVWDRMKFHRKNVAAELYCSFRGLTFRIIYGDKLEEVS